MVLAPPIPNILRAIFRGSLLTPAVRSHVDEFLPLLRYPSSPLPQAARLKLDDEIWIRAGTVLETPVVSLALDRQPEYSSSVILFDPPESPDGRFE